MIKLSFILPVYNVEPYIEKCIRSIRDKDMPYEDYEIIIVNDGSPDNCELIVRRLQNEIDNIILINQENSGVSVARNKGIEKATGEYIVFIDPDDFVNPDLLNRLYDRAKKDDLDILLCGRSIVKPNGEVYHMVGYEKQQDQLYNGVDAFKEKDKPYKVFDNCWGRLYSRKLIQEYSINFPEGVIHLEDGVFIRKVFVVADRVSFENCDFYQAFERPGSASRSDIGTSNKAVIGDVISCKDLLNFKQSYTFNASQIGLINSGIIKYALLPLMRAINSKSFKDLISYDRMLVKKNLKPLKINYVPKGLYLDLAKAYNQSLWVFTIKYIIKKKLQNVRSN